MHFALHAQYGHALSHKNPAPGVMNLHFWQSLNYIVTLCAKCTWKREDDF